MYMCVCDIQRPVKIRHCIGPCRCVFPHCLKALYHRAIPGTFRRNAGSFVAIKSALFKNILYVLLL